MTYDKYQNWLMLIENNDIDELEEAIREEIHKLVRVLGLICGYLLNRGRGWDAYHS